MRHSPNICVPRSNSASSKCHAGLVTCQKQDALDSQSDKSQKPGLHPHPRPFPPDIPLRQYPSVNRNDAKQGIPCIGNSQQWYDTGKLNTAPTIN